MASRKLMPILTVITNLILTTTTRTLTTIMACGIRIMVLIKNKLEAVRKDYYSKDQDHITPNEIRKLKLKTDSVLPVHERADIADFIYSMRDCISTHDNHSVHCKTIVSLNSVNLKPFYIRPYLTHEKEIKFAEAEMEKLMKMGILRRGLRVSANKSSTRWQSGMILLEDEPNR